MRRRRPMSMASAVMRGAHLRWWVAILLVALAVAASGYVALLGWSPTDALYMTVITMTTVGFREVHDLNAIGQLWTMLVAVSGVAIIFGGVGIVAERLTTDIALGRRETRQMAQAIEALRGHIIVCGYGRVGSTAVRELVARGEVPVVIDVNPSSLEAARAEGRLVVEGNATRAATLQGAGIERARILLTMIDSDVDNVYVTLSARTLNPGLFIVARAGLEDTDAMLLQAGANRVVSPYARAGRHAAELAIRPRVADFIDSALSHGELRFSLEEVEVAAGGVLDGQTIDDLRSRGIHVLAIAQGQGGYEPNPPAERRLQAGDSLVVSGAADPLRRLRERV